MWAVLVGSILTGLVLDLAASVFTYRVWEADAEEAGRVMHVTLGQHLSGWVQISSFFALLTLVGFALALRGRRLLFAAPALSFTFVPILIDLYHGATGSLIPGLFGNVGFLARDFGEWVYWAESGIKLALVLIPGALVAGRVETVRNPFHSLAVGVMTVPAWMVGYYAAIYFSHNGQLNGGDGAGYVAVFCLGAAMGFDRPIWPWAIAVLPALPHAQVVPLFYADGAESLLLIGIALLGAITVPLSRVFQRAWLEDRDTGRSLVRAAD